MSVVCILALFFLCVIGKLFVVQIIQGKSLQIRAISQWTRDLTMSGLRGKILDCNGEILASSYTSYNAYVRANAVVDREYIASVLSKELDIKYDTILAKMNTKVSECLIKTQVEHDVAKRLIDLDLDGVYLTETSTRQYPYNDMLASVMGFTTTDNIGQAGLERYYNNFLTGFDGESYVESTITGKEISNATTSFLQGTPGCDITLTIDKSIQEILESLANTAMIEQKAKRVNAIVMDAQSGAIKAMVIKPSLDLNKLPRDNVDLLFEYTKNVNIVDVYEPGSTFKLFTLAAALSEGLTNENERFYDPGYRIVDGEKIKCWRTKGHGSETLVEGLCNSCNSVFMDLGLRLGKERLYSYLTKFGFGKVTNVDFNGESSGIMMNESLVKNVDLARISFGQAIAVTPLQMITGVCAVLNGNLYQPHFVEKIASAGGEKRFNPVIVDHVIDKEVSERISSMMEQVVSTKGLYSFVEGYRIGGKTGTAQKYEDGHIANGKYVSSFVGIYPVSNPQYVLLFCVDEASAGAYYGSVVAAPYGKKFFSGLLNYLNIAPSNLTQDLAKMQADIPVPNLVGKSITEAVSELKRRRLDYEVDGDGDLVIWQSIPEGEKLFEGGIVVLKT